MAKTPLRLVPSSGKKLADVARNVELLAALSATLLSVIARQRPEVKDEMISSFRAFLSRKDLSAHEREIYRDALRIVRELVLQ